MVGDVKSFSNLWFVKVSEFLLMTISVCEVLLVYGNSVVVVWRVKGKGSLMDKIHFDLY